MSNFTVDRESSMNSTGQNNGNYAEAGVGESSSNYVGGEDCLGVVDAEQRRPMIVEEGDIVSGVGKERGEGGKRTGHKVIVGLAVMVGIIGLALFGAWLGYGKGTTRRARVGVKAGGENSNSGVQSEEGMTKQAIQEATGSVGTKGGVALGDGTEVQPQVLPVATRGSMESSVPVTQIPGATPTLSGTVEGAQTGSAPLGSGPLGQPGANAQSLASATGGRNGERSVRIGDVVGQSPVGKEENKRAGLPREMRGSGSKPAEAGGVALPSFGSMLPVRSLGVLFTLRSGSLARFELTRDVRGNGWVMHRGTVMVGANRGSEADRAFVSLVGFIDPESGKFVRMSGDLLGSDGATGIRGKKRKVSGGWSRALGKVAEAGVNIATSVAGSIGRGPVVVTDAYRSSGSRVSNELDGMLIRSDRNSFVEVAAGTSGYMMVTDLPEAIQGGDALSRLSGREVEERADSGQPRRATGISERELAELVQSGDHERLSAALPRMSPEMRRVAESVIKERSEE